jgi:hypothetical protein
VIGFSQNEIQLPELNKFKADIDTIINTEEYLLRVDIDTLMIINKKGVIDYGLCRKTVRDLHAKLDDYQKVTSIIDAVSLEFDSLNTNIKSLETKYELSLMENINSNKLLRQENEIISNTLERTKKELNVAKLKIKKETWNISGKKILWGAGGIIVGALVAGTLISINN